MSDEETTATTAAAIIAHEELLARLHEDEAILESRERTAIETLKDVRAARGEISSAAALAPDEARIAKLERQLRLIRAAIAEEERRRPELEARHEAAMDRARERSEYLVREAAKGRAAVANGRMISDVQHRLMTGAWMGVAATPSEYLLEQRMAETADETQEEKRSRLRRELAEAEDPGAPEGRTHDLSGRPR